MNGTPRLRSAYPATPQNRTPQSNGTPRSAHQTPNSPKLPDITSLAPSKPAPGAPLISFDIIDAPSQRLYAFGIFVLLWIWRLYDWSNLMADETESLWLFMKWLVLDLTYLYFLESAHIPWLEFGPVTQTVFFTLHAVMNGLLMFRIPIRFLTYFGALMNYVWDSELAISGASVKYSNVVNNPSLILGKQIIHVLPEGSAVLNPDHIPLCLDLSKASSSTALPLRINQTIPVSIDLIRFDLDTPFNETFTISSSQAKRLRKDAMKGRNLDSSEPVTLQLPLKKPGLYRLNRMVDETKMDVSLRSSSEALVVACPSARIRSPTHDRCRGDLSNVAIEVEGTPPLRVKYTKSIGGKAFDKSYQSIQPEDFVSPLARQREPGPLVAGGDMQLFWANAHKVQIPLNESLIESGRWSYAIEEVVDALGNTASYSLDEDVERQKARPPHTEQGLVVHDRPKVSLKSPETQGPVRVAKGQSVPFPLQFSSTKKSAISDSAHGLTYRFTPVRLMTERGDHGANSEVRDLTVKTPNSVIKVHEPGLYTLLSVNTPFCDGEVLEPTSFMLVNPPEPDMSIDVQDITDRCAGRAIGFRVGLDLLGTPPFKVQYTIKQRGKRSSQIHTKEVQGLRDQVEFRPREEGHYTYTFTEVSDDVYRGIDLRHKSLELSHDVKPAVSASFVDNSAKKHACIDQPASFEVRLQGEGPWMLDYEIVHSGRRTKQKSGSVEQDHYTIVTPPLSTGGEYSIVLTGVTDKHGCRETLQQDAKVQVRHQRPKVAFGPIEGQRSLRTLERKNVDIPLRLTGEAPWTVKYQVTDRSNETRILTTQVKNQNGIISTKEPGSYDLLEVNDAICPGSVEKTASKFDIAWIGRPLVTVNPNTVLKQVDDHFERNAICEGEEDAFEIFLSGRPPYEVQYQEDIVYTSGQKARKDPPRLDVPLNSASIKMDSSASGLYTYTFTELGDYNYDHSSSHHQPLTVRQRVHPRPQIAFAEPRKVYSICQAQDADRANIEGQRIPIKFSSGQAPYSFDLEISRSGRASRAETISFNHAQVDSKGVYHAELPPTSLPPGSSSVQIRRVRDSRGCLRDIPPDPSQRVQISVHDIPTISPIEARENFCVGERLAFSLSGQPPYTIFYTFEGKQRKATENSPTFRRLAEQQGEMIVTALADSSSQCKRNTEIKRRIHPYPRVKVSKGRVSRVDIHAGGEAEIHFDFEGSPPFTFTYTRSANIDDTKNAKGNTRPGQVLETKTLTSYEKNLNIKASDEGTYEVVAIKDAFCSYARPGHEGFLGSSGGKLLKERGD